MCIRDSASTTENPYFYIYNALLSRATVFEFKPLTPEDVRRGLENALHKLEELDGVRIEEMCIRDSNYS